MSTSCTGPLDRHPTADALLKALQPLPAHSIGWLTGVDSSSGMIVDACAVAFNELKAALTHALVLAYPDVQQPFIVDTDASSVGVRAVLSQGGKEEKRAVAYFSHALIRAEKNYRSQGLSLCWSLELHNGVMYRRWKAQGQGANLLQLLVPQKLRAQAIQVVHGSVRAGHYGNAKTLQQLRRRFYWPNCRRDVELQKGPSQRSHAPLQQYLVGAPIEQVALKNNIIVTYKSKYSQDYIWIKTNSHI